ncbi:RadC family protein [Sporolactobacillus nakayamae]|uniref:DNA repair protein RadC n=1 Tax=Sporolactobacillus nakayamae TaxID=269670 RepID=A0A1I2U718_9BACL|nr:DNA repair protein RadC [Sporolactobacillus nakayamae]SFG70636.1 DNA repair protein RadC [Sporolactobacillus nakayamae]
MNDHYELAKEELSFYGNENTSLQNILAVLIGPKASPSITGELSGLGVDRLATLSIEELKKFQGIGETAAKRINSAFGLAFKIRKFSKKENYTIRSPQDAADYFSDLEQAEQEYLDAIYLNTKNAVISRKNIFKGSLNASIVHPREVFKEAVRLSAASVIVAHNHPSGDPTPSKEDIDVTKRLASTGKVLGIELLDHIVIGAKSDYVSLKEKKSI